MIKIKSGMITKAWEGAVVQVSSLSSFSSQAVEGSVTQQGAAPWGVSCPRERNPTWSKRKSWGARKELQRGTAVFFPHPNATAPPGEGEEMEMEGVGLSLERQEWREVFYIFCSIFLLSNSILIVSKWNEFSLNGVCLSLVVTNG